MVNKVSTCFFLFACEIYKGAGALLNCFGMHSLGRQVEYKPGLLPTDRCPGSKGNSLLHYSYCLYFEYGKEMALHN